MGFPGSFSYSDSNYYKSQHSISSEGLSAAYTASVATSSVGGRGMLQLCYPSNLDSRQAEITPELIHTSGTESHVMRNGDLIRVQIGNLTPHYVVSTGTPMGSTAGFSYEPLVPPLPASERGCNISYTAGIKEYVLPEAAITDGVVMLKRADGGADQEAVILADMTTVRIDGVVAGGTVFSGYRHAVRFARAGRPYLHIISSSGLPRGVRAPYLGMKRNSCQPLWSRYGGGFVSPYPINLDVDTYVLVQIQCNRNGKTDATHLASGEKLEIVGKVQRDRLSLRLGESYTRRLTLPIPLNTTSAHIRILNPDHTLYQLNGTEWGMTIRINVSE
jgi:hypothetical protein